MCALRRCRDLGKRLGFIGRSLHKGFAIVEHHVIGVRLKHVGSNAFGFFLDLIEALLHRRAAGEGDVVVALDVERDVFDGVAVADRGAR